MRLTVGKHLGKIGAFIRIDIRLVALCNCESVVIAFKLCGNSYDVAALDGKNRAVIFKTGDALECRYTVIEFKSRFAKAEKIHKARVAGNIADLEQLRLI